MRVLPLLCTISVLAVAELGAETVRGGNIVATNTAGSYAHGNSSYLKPTDGRIKYLPNSAKHNIEASYLRGEKICVIFVCMCVCVFEIKSSFNGKSLFTSSTENKKKYFLFQGQTPGLCQI